jgi:hypothetical protein
VIPAVAAAKDTNPWTESEMVNNRPTPDRVEEVPEEHLPPGCVTLGHGDVLIAAITSCTNTSNPSVMLGAGLLAKKAVERGLFVSPKVKASLAPGSRVVTEYLARTGLQPYLDRLGFQLVGYGCTTCIGNSGPLDPHRGGRDGQRSRRRERPLGQPQLRGAHPAEHQGQLPDEPAARRGLRAGRARGHRHDAGASAATGRGMRSS